MKIIKSLLQIVAIAFFMSPLWAADDDVAKIELIAGEVDSTPTAGIDIQIADGWKIYAPNTGDSTAMPPELEWQDSTNLQGVDVLWPMGEKDKFLDDDVWVYKKHVLIPVKITPKDHKKPVVLKFVIHMLACNKLCVPIDQELELTLDQNTTEHQVVEEAISGHEKDYEGMSLLTILLLAVLGGFILNFMPCVLPIISIKFMSFAKNPKAFSYEALIATVLGIMTSFWILAGLSIGLKLVGEVAGWGIHFQNAYFIVFIAFLVGLFTANMLGLFEFHLPPKLSDNLTGALSGSRSHNFLTGVFATLLATPCSAPFLGTSVSFALARDPFDIFIVFSALGLGFAIPYLLIMLIPSHKLPLPRPGTWMVVLQRVMGVFLLGTFAWLLFIMKGHISWLGIAVFLALLLISIIINHVHKSFSLVVLLVAAIAIYSAPQFDGEVTVNSEESDVSEWTRFGQVNLKELIDGKQVVMVNVTADWCVTCQANKQLVLNREEFKEFAKAHDLKLIEGDWTKKDPAITKFLEEHGRYGIPFTIVMGPGSPNGVLLPELLNMESIKRAYDQAK